MSVTRAQFVAEARTWLGTPFMHQGRLRGVGCDCIGLVIGTAQALGLTDFDITDYGRRPDGRVRPTMETQLDWTAPAEAQAGDVLLFAWAASPIHVAIMTDESHMIHAYLPNRAVVESIMDERMRLQIVAAYHVPGVE
ncbi:NlpC/P60 family protein [Paraburkholderia phymatum]|uniref:Putative phage cell wall peptidase, NlpC/P60 family n=1 Tax=Paraburkholderia phymatum (strain DSM 17167 / CIP 108236 / LMG 21445 / STM815) TaxID=391038 RepID=B2JUI7_PARP8|nr:NlpC/P60 family protein [Paraburkholderia phymatum]ACC76158.1 putative phage cell wall peptidase, NlpC/P60 family [Paraburkholderia phymatum STM815]